MSNMQQFICNVNLRRRPRAQRHRGFGQMIDDDVGGGRARRGIPAFHAAVPPADTRP